MSNLCFCSLCIPLAPVDVSEELELSPAVYSFHQRPMLHITEGAEAVRGEAF